MSNSIKTILIVILAVTSLLSIFMTFRFRKLRQQVLLSNDEQFHRQVNRKIKAYTIFIMLVLSCLIIMTAYLFIGYFSH